MNKNKGLVNLDEDEKLEIAKRRVTKVKGNLYCTGKPQHRKGTGRGRGRREEIERRRAVVLDLFVRKGYSYEKIQGALANKGMRVSINTVAADIKWLKRTFGDIYSIETILWMTQQKCEKTYNLAYENMVAAGPGSREAIQALNVMKDIALGVYRVVEPQKTTVTFDIKKNLSQLPAPPSLKSAHSEVDVIDLSEKDWEGIIDSYTTRSDSGETQDIRTLPPLSTTSGATTVP